MSKKIVFFFPSFASTEATAPLGILAVATPLLRAGYTVQLVDSTITPNYKKRVLSEVQDALCLGISLVTGPMIRETVEIARAVKEWNPEFPVILGGWHPSLLPKQTLEARDIDIVVRGQGEETLLEVVEHLEQKSPLDLIPGVGFKRNGKLIFTTERPLTNEVVGGGGPCIFLASPVRSTVPIARTPESMAGNGTRCRRSNSLKKPWTSRDATASRCCGSWMTIF